ncbi:MAG: hypothetical protein AAF170_02980 [Bacteroidota bacterium]
MAKSSKSRVTSKTKRPAPLEGNEVWRKRGRVRKVGATQRDTTWWAQLSGRVQHAICIGFLTLVALGFYASSTVGGKNLAGGDTVQWRATAEALLAHEEETGTRPLWAPSLFGGMPAYLLSYPTATPGLDTIANTLRAVGLWPFAHMMILLLGTYFLVLFLTRSKLAGTLSAVAFGLTAYLPILLSAGHNSKFITLAYSPWLLLAFAALVRRPPSTSALWSGLLACLFAIVASINLRAGHIQITYYVVFVAGIWWVAEGIAAIRGHNTKTFLASTGLLVIGSAVALAIVAQPYLAQWEYKAFTMRSVGESGGMTWADAMAWSQGIGELLTLLIPNAYGGAGGSYWGPKLFTAGPHYVGPVVLLLALIGLVGVARRSVLAFGVAAVVMTLFALGEFLPLVNRTAFEVLPLFNVFRVPETWLAAVALVLALLAGWGAYYLYRAEATSEAEARKQRWVLIIGGVFLVTVIGLRVTDGFGLDFQKPGEREQIELAVASQAGVPLSDPRVAETVASVLRSAKADRSELFREDALRTLLFLALALGLVGAMLWTKVPSWAAVAGLILLVTADLWGVARRYYNEDIPALRARSNSEAIVRAQLSDADRFLAERVQEAGGYGHFRVLPPSPLSNGVPSYVAESIGGYHGVRLAGIQDYFDRILPDSAGYNPNALALLSARYIVAGGAPAPGLTPVFQDPRTGAVVYENPSALPRAFFVDSVAVVASAEAAIEAIRQPEFTPRTTALLSEPPPNGITPVELTGAAPDSGAVRVALDRYTPDEIVWTVRTDRPRLFVASEMYYPAGWVAQINEAEVPIVRVNHLLRGISVPAGEHIVTMRFQPATHRQSVLISWVATLLAYLGAVVFGGLVWWRRGHPAS